MHTKNRQTEGKVVDNIMDCHGQNFHGQSNGVITRKHWKISLEFAKVYEVVSQFSNFQKTKLVLGCWLPLAT